MLASRLFVTDFERRDASHRDDGSQDGALKSDYPRSVTPPAGWVRRVRAAGASLRTPCAGMPPGAPGALKSARRRFWHAADYPLQPVREFDWKMRRLDVGGASRQCRSSVDRLGQVADRARPLGDVRRHRSDGANGGRKTPHEPALEEYVSARRFSDDYSLSAAPDRMSRLRPKRHRAPWSI